MPPLLCCRKLAKRFADHVALDDMNWDVPHGAFMGLLGRSGAGKTTLLRILAGLDDQYNGEVLFHPNRPRVGMVFQDLALWPHLTARQHLRCVISNGPRSTREEKIDRVVQETQFPAIALDRRPDQLSGGEAQRLALARALVIEPELLLLDEPLAHVDADLRLELSAMIRKVVLDRQLTAIYVTHDEHETHRLCTHLAFMADGKIANRELPDR